MVRVGLTGSIGSGKSLVGRMFRILGIPVFDADSEARNLYQLPEVQAKLSAIAGENILLPGGQVDRKKLASILFNDPEKLQLVNGFIHPLVRKAFAGYASESPEKPYIIYEAAILIESGYYRELDRLIVVHAPEDLRISRVMNRDKVTREEVAQRMRSQMPDEEKLKAADWVIINDGSLLVIPQVLEIDKALRA